MLIRYRWLWASMMVLVLSACASYPLGMSEQEWQALSPEQQLTARERQAQLDQAERVRRAAAAEQRAERERAEQREYQQRLSQAQPGEVVQCVVNHGEGYYGGQWLSAEPAGVTLLRGFSQTLQVAQRDRPSRSVQLEMEYVGASVRLCRVNQRDCSTIAATQNQFRQGVTRSVNIPRTLRGEIYCDIPRPFYRKERE